MLISTQFYLLELSHISHPISTVLGNIGVQLIFCEHEADVKRRGKCSQEAC